MAHLQLIHIILLVIVINDVELLILVAAVATGSVSTVLVTPTMLPAFSNAAALALRRLPLVLGPSVLKPDLYLK